MAKHVRMDTTPEDTTAKQMMHFGEWTPPGDRTGARVWC